MINGKKMGLGILSYKAHDTLKKTLFFDSKRFSPLVGVEDKVH